jgi:hypothetical protein
MSKEDKDSEGMDIGIDDLIKSITSDLDSAAGYKPGSGSAGFEVGDFEIELKVGLMKTKKGGIALKIFDILSGEAGGQVAKENVSTIKFKLKPGKYEGGIQTGAVVIRGVVYGKDDNRLLMAIGSEYYRVQNPTKELISKAHIINTTSDIPVTGKAEFEEKEDHFNIKLIQGDKE